MLHQRRIRPLVVSTNSKVQVCHSHPLTCVKSTVVTKSAIVLASGSNRVSGERQRRLKSEAGAYVQYHERAKPVTKSARLRCHSIKLPRACRPPQVLQDFRLDQIRPGQPGLESCRPS